jgi:hypothetical protein
VNSPELNKPLFRENALKSLSASDHIQQSLKVVEAKFIGYLCASFLILLALFIWGLFGEIEVQVSARGMVLSGQQLKLAEKLYQENRVDRIAALQAVKSLLDKKQQLFNKHYLTIDDLERARQDYLNAKERISNTPRLNNENVGNLFFREQGVASSPLEALVFVSHNEGKKINSGMSVYLLPTTLSAYEYGYIKGTVLSVSAYPASKESVYSYLGNMSLVDEYFIEGAPFVVRIALDKNSQTKSGLSWTSKRGAPFSIDVGSTVTAKIINHQYHPLDLLLRQYHGG